MILIRESGCENGLGMLSDSIIMLSDSMMSRWKVNQTNHTHWPDPVPKIEGMTQRKKATLPEIKRVMKALSSRRMTKITPARRSEIARAAAQARWSKKRKTED
jgi:hypothetical protein